MSIFVSDSSALLVLSNGAVFRGQSVGAPGIRIAETVFSTAMTGYQEVLTDPSYTGQIVTMTCSHIGNVGVNPDDSESLEPVGLAGLVVYALSETCSNWRGTETLSSYLRRKDIVAISDVDTRRLTRMLRSEGVQVAILVAARPGELLDEAAIVKQVTDGALVPTSTKALSSYQPDRRFQDISASALGDVERWGRPPAVFLQPERCVLVLDFGVKISLLRALAVRGVTSLRLCAPEMSLSEILDYQPDGIVLSNGPGDPRDFPHAVALIQALLAKKDIVLFGVCLGHQLLGLACGARVEKLKFGHRGVNHPVKEEKTQRVLITSQNHGYVLNSEHIPEDLEVSHISLFDQTVQGVRHRSLPAFSVQGHPEAGPGPSDWGEIFDEFISAVNVRAR